MTNHPNRRKLRTQLAFVKNGYGFLRGYCSLCRPKESVQVASDGGDDGRALARVHAEVVHHLETVHGKKTDGFLGMFWEKTTD